jgi:type II secretory pathway pseudopilin PulG
VHGWVFSVSRRLPIPFSVHIRARSEDGFLMVELMVAVMVVVIALLALAAAYDQSFFSLRSSAKTSSAGVLAENQLEVYASLSYGSIGFTSSALNSAESTDSTYSSDESALPGTGSDVTITSCSASPQCSPVQTLTGGDHRTYKLETFIRLLSNPSSSGRMEKVVTVVVRDLTGSGAEVLTMQTGFDAGPPS